MKTKITILFYAKSSRSLKNGLTPIYLRITVDGVRIEINTPNYINKTKWSVESEMDICKQEYRHYFRDF